MLLLRFCSARAFASARFMSQLSIESVIRLLLVVWSHSLHRDWRQGLHPTAKIVAWCQRPSATFDGAQVRQCGWLHKVMCVRCVRLSTLRRYCGRGTIEFILNGPLGIGRDSTGNDDRVCANVARVYLISFWGPGVDQFFRDLGPTAICRQRSKFLVEREPVCPVSEHPLSAEGGKTRSSPFELSRTAAGLAPESFGQMVPK